jgi:UDP-N-acetylglucosamine acyltransferase
MSVQANIHPNAKIGKGTTIEPFATVNDDVEIGENCWIGPNAVIMAGTRIGNNCKVFPGAVIGAEPQDLKFDGEYTTVEIGNNTTIRECVTIQRGTTDKHKTVIGNNCLLMTYVHIAHDCEVGNNCIIAGYSGLSGHNVIEDFVIIEGMVGTQQFIRIGEHSFIAGGTMVRKNIPPYVRAAREPISYAGINAIGLRRRGFSDDVIKKVEDIYRHLFVMNNTIPSGLEAIEKEVDNCEQKTKVLDFVRNSDRGIMRGFNS